MRRAQRLLSYLLKVFFYLLYEPLAWSYDLVAWVVSLGRWKSWVHAGLPEISGPRVLELGHGPGHLQTLLSEGGIQAVGIDRSQQMGRLASRRIRRSGFASLLVRATAERLPFQRRVFDDVVATFPTDYILSSNTLASIRRVLNHKGTLILIPVAWITGGTWLDRAAAWLFRATRQAGAWDSRFSDTIHQAGFMVKEKRVNLETSELMLVLAKPK